MSKKDRLEEALLDFIESTLKEPKQENELALVPAMAHELIELWKD